MSHLHFLIYMKGKSIIIGIVLLLLLGCREEKGRGEEVEILVNGIPIQMTVVEGDSMKVSSVEYLFLLKSGLAGPVDENEEFEVLGIEGKRTRLKCKVMEDPEFRPQIGERVLKKMGIPTREMPNTCE